MATDKGLEDVPEGKFFLLRDLAIAFGDRWALDVPDVERVPRNPHRLVSMDARMPHSRPSQDLALSHTHSG